MRGTGSGQAPLRHLVVKTEFVQAVYQLLQPLPLLVDDLPVVSEGVEEGLSFGDR